MTKQEFVLKWQEVFQPNFNFAIEEEDFQELVGDIAETFLGADEAPGGDSHDQNTDTKLAEGTQYEVTAAQLKFIIDNFTKEVAIYNPGEVVQLGWVRSFADKFWEYINNTPGAGHEPAENTYWKEISKAEALVQLAQTTGQSTTVGMSQKAITDFVNNKPVKLTEFENQAGLSVLANATNTSGKPTAIAATTAERILARTASNTLAWIQATTNMILDRAMTTVKIALNAVTNAELAQMPGNTVKANLAGSTGNAGDYPATNIYNDEQAMFHYDLDGIKEVMSSTIKVLDADVTVANTTVKTSLFEFTIPAYILRPKKEFEMELEGLISTAASPGNLTIDSELGAVVLSSSGAVAVTGSQANELVRIKFKFTCRTIGVTGIVIGQGFFNDKKIVMTAPATVNTQTDLVFKISATWSTADAANNLKITNGRVKRHF